MLHHSWQEAVARGSSISSLHLSLSLSVHTHTPTLRRDTLSDHLLKLISPNTRGSSLVTLCYRCSSREAQLVDFNFPTSRRQTPLSSLAMTIWSHWRLMVGGCVSQGRSGFMLTVAAHKVLCGELHNKPTRPPHAGSCDIVAPKCHMKLAHTSALMCIIYS